jgi:hypothetical protein
MDVSTSTGGGDFLGGGLGTGGGLIGGLILGALLRNNGNLFGTDGAGAVAGATLRNPPEQNQANMDLMAAIGGVDKSVAVNQAAMEASQAAQTGTLSNQMSSIASALTSTVTSQSMATNGAIAGVKDAVNGNSVALMSLINGVDKNVLTSTNVITQAINTDGDKTRALLVQQYEAALNRQITDANARIVALENRRDLDAVQRGVEVNTTNNINQMQQQQQQQAQYSNLYNALWGLSQSIRSTNEAINVGSGTLTANPANTNTNIR